MKNKLTKKEQEEVDQIFNDIAAGKYGLEAQFSKYLGDTFWEEMWGWAGSPEGTEFGERVAYKLKPGIKAVRHEMSDKELAEFDQLIKKVAKNVGLDESNVITEPPATSGLPYPRFVDLPGWDIALGYSPDKKTDGGELTQWRDCPIEWALGVINYSSEKVLVYFDFTNPRVKGVFTSIFESEYDTARSNWTVFEWYSDFQSRLYQCQKMADEGKLPFEWVKMSQSDDELRITTKDKNGMIKKTTEKVSRDNN